MTSPSARPSRSVEASIRIAVGVDDVWRAISDGEWLSRWFSPTASVTPGKGGKVAVSWGGGAEWTSRITAWEPGLHLRLEDEPHDGADQGVTTLDYHLESTDGATLVRLVNAGYPADAEWDDHIRMLENGWRFFLWNLKHALERHLGVPRTMISARPWVSGTRAELWDRLFSPEGLGPLAGAHSRYRLELDGGHLLEGTVVLRDRPWAFAGVVESMNDGVLHVELEGDGDRWKLGVWLSLYGVAPAESDQLRAALQKTIGRVSTIRRVSTTGCVPTTGHVPTTGRAPA